VIVPLLVTYVYWGGGLDWARVVGAANSRKPTMRDQILFIFLKKGCEFSDESQVRCY
jgi:hypothetical protein